MCFWWGCVRARVWSTHANGSTIIRVQQQQQMCFIRPIKKILQFQLAHLHEPIFITSPNKGKNTLSFIYTTATQLFARLCVSAYCILFFDNFRCRCIGLHHFTLLSLSFSRYGFSCWNVKMKLWRKNYTLENTSTISTGNSCAIVLIEITS